MSRTTLDIDDPILRDVKRLSKKERKSLGRTVTELLAEALHLRKSGKPVRPPFHWHARHMGPGVDFSDKEAIWQTLDSEDREGK